VPGTSALRGIGKQVTPTRSEPTDRRDRPPHFCKWLPSPELFFSSPPGLVDFEFFRSAEPLLGFRISLRGEFHPDFSLNTGGTEYCVLSSSRAFRSFMIVSFCWSSGKHAATMLDFISKQGDELGPARSPTVNL